jgi:hypothetical protein
VRLVVYDRTCKQARGRLTHAWAAGARLYRGLGRIDDACGVASWSEALGYLAAQREPVREIQYWGHGKWGAALVGEEPLDAEAIRARLRALLEAVRERLAPDALVWFRTCETLGARAGLDFAERLADFLGARIAGHTYVIGFHQSGLHGLAPGVRADWSPDEGLAEGTAEQPRRAKWSRPWAPRTITCLGGTVPASWFTMR